jgi:Carboxypeptidase regulatory-like domain
MPVRSFTLHLFVALAMVMSLLAASPALAQDELPAWGVVPSPNAGSGPSSVAAVSALSDADVWAVGRFDSDGVHPLVQHWDGGSWSLVPTPPIAEAELLGVEAVASNDVWMVGGFQSTGDALILHWDGTGLNVVDHPNPGLFNRLYGVSAVSADDVWAVGEFANGGVSKTLTLHYDGTAWTLVPSPNAPGGSYNSLLAVEAIAPNDVWAVGEEGSDTLSLHWSGSAWAVIQSPSEGSTSSFKGVSASSSRNVWAVGDGSQGTLTARWTGRKWRVVPSPDPGNFFEDLNAVDVVGPNEAWAVGFYDGNGGDWLTLVLHWNGRSWRVVPSPSPHPSLNALNGVSALPGTDVWAGGFQGFDVGGKETLIERGNEEAWAVVPSANGGTAPNQLYALSANSSDDIWAVGESLTKSLVQHYDGQSWSIVLSPNLPFGLPLQDVVAIAPDDVWAVGFSGDPGSLDSMNAAIHWDGVEWTIVPTPQPGGQSVDELHAIDAIAPDDVWAVGEYWDDNFVPQPLTMHWDGASWTVVPNDCGSFLGLRGITVIAPDLLWAVGDATTCRYDGTTWTEVPSPQPRPQFQEVAYPLEDVSGTGPNDVWAVGARVIDQPKFVTFASFTEHWNGTRWVRVEAVPGQILRGVEAITPDDVYAVGTTGASPLIVHNDGSGWEAVPTPDSDEGGQLFGVEEAAPDDLWAVGTLREDLAPARTFILNAPSETEGAVIGSTNVSGATVSWFGPETGSVETDVFGDYAVAGLAEGTYTIIATHAGCDPDSAQVTIVAGETVIQDFQLGC